MRNMILRFTLSAVLLVGLAATPAVAGGPGDPPPGTTSISTLVLILSSLIPH